MRRQSVSEGRLSDMLIAVRIRLCDVVLVFLFVRGVKSRQILHVDIHIYLVPG